MPPLGAAAAYLDAKFAVLRTVEFERVAHIIHTFVARNIRTLRRRTTRYAGHRLIPGVVAPLGCIEPQEVRSLKSGNSESRQVGCNTQTAVLARLVAVLGHPPALAVFLDRIARQLDRNRHGNRREIFAHFARPQFVLGHDRNRLCRNHYIVVNHPNGDYVSSLAVDDRYFCLFLLGDRPFVGIGPLNLRHRKDELLAAVAGQRGGDLGDRSGLLGNGHLLNIFFDIAFHGLSAGNQRRHCGHTCRGHYVFLDIFHVFLF